MEAVKFTAAQLTALANLGVSAVVFSNQYYDGSVYGKAIVAIIPPTTDTTKIKYVTIGDTGSVSAVEV